MKYIIIFMLLLFALGCTEAQNNKVDIIPDEVNTTKEEERDLPQGATVLEETLYSGSASYSATDLCSLVQAATIGGVYRVSFIYSNFQDQDDGSSKAPFTFIELTKMEEWLPGSPDIAVARIMGGKFPNGNSLASEVEAKLGDEFGVLLFPINATSDYFHIGGDLIFSVGSGVQSIPHFGQRIFDKEDFVSKVKAIAEADKGTCPVNIEPEE